MIICNKMKLLTFFNIYIDVDNSINTFYKNCSDSTLMYLNFIIYFTVISINKTEKYEIYVLHLFPS